MKNVLAALVSVSLLSLAACSGGTNTTTDGGTQPADAGTGGGTGGGSGGGTGGGTGGGAGGGGGGGLPPTAAQAAAVQAALSCYGLSCLFTVSPGNCDALGSFGSGFDPGASVAAGRMTYDPAKGQACKDLADGLLATSCFGENSPVLTGATLPPACDQMFTGTVANGASCYDTEECAAGYCDFSANTCPGTCTAKKAAAASCDDDEECQAGLSCESGTCAAPLALGASCGGNVPGDCGQGLYCNDSGKCSNVKVALGDDCTSNTMCPDGAACIRSNFSVPTGLCTQVQPEGGTCNSGGFFFFPFSLECKGIQVCAGLQVDPSMDAVVTPGTCTIPQSVGGPCFPNAGTLGGNGCFIDLVCDPATQKCAAAPAVGQACITGRCAEGAYCNPTNDTCAAKKADGATCAESEECLGACSGGSCATQPDTRCKP